MFELWLAKLGPMAWPLLFCSIATVALILERLWYFSVNGTRLDEAVRQNKREAQNGLLRAGLELLQEHRRKPRELREEILSTWLRQRRRELQAHLGWLQLLAVISPLLGLLGTIVGMIEAFQAIAAHTGPVSPALIADGLWTAMLTTAAGLAIAVPALIAVHGFRIWAAAVLDSLMAELQRHHLGLEETIEHTPTPSAPITDQVSAL